MQNRQLLAVITLMLAGLAAAASAADPETAARRIRAHTTFLADDLLEGRGTGTRGHELAARYVTAQFARLGIAPGADHASYEQPIRLLESTVNREAGRLVVLHEGKEDALTPINDMVASIAPGQTATTITAPAVFVGFGVHVPELGYDDFQGVDLRGKIAVVLAGAPKSFPNAQRAHHGHRDQKQALLVRHGAVGMVTVMTPLEESRRPWAVTVELGRFPTMRLVSGDGILVDGYPELRALASVSRAAASRLFVGAPQTLEETYAKAARNEPQAFPLNVSLTLAGESTIRPVKSMNILGWLPGTDAALADQPLVITGHLDHLGIGTPVNGDAIYNGAVDNALGIAVLLQVAEELAASPRSRRPVLFAAVTGEEKGLLGARHLADHPPAQVRRYAANLNIDMPLLSAPARTITAHGADHSTLGAVVRQVAGRHGLTVGADPAPDEVRFVRSDQYPFILRGVPALKVDPGLQALDPAVDLVAAETDFRRHHYHKPSDDLSRPIDWAAAARYAALITDLARTVADSPEAPAWLPGDFFGELFGRDR
jgi:hypothetical protein